MRQWPRALTIIYKDKTEEEKNMSIYDFKVNTLGGQEVTLEEYKGKVLIIVNTASKCGFTPQFSDLEKIYQEYRAQGVEVLGFPSNQFAEQEPGDSHEIEHFCKINYGVTFPLFAKGEVRGDNAQPLFQYLSQNTSFQGFDLNHANGKMLQGFIEEKFPQYLEGNSIKWNFTKFLIDRQGNIVERFEPTTEPLAMIPAIEKLL
jgi:glutathione peroxidase